MKYFQHAFQILLITFFCNSVFAQPKSSISQNFDVACVTTGDFPSGWYRYNPISTTIPKGQWHCEAEGGRDTTPGLMCTGYYDNVFHKDTAYLITPLLNLPETTYGGHNIYLQFDTKSNIPDSSGLTIFTSYDDLFDSSDPRLDTGVNPKVGTADDTVWRTHQVNLTPYIGGNNFFLGFRYVSTDTAGSTWHIDNVYTTTARLVVEDVHVAVPSVKITGASSANRTDYSILSPAQGNYEVQLYGMDGRIIYTASIIAGKGVSHHSITNAGLSAGIYCLRVVNISGSAVVRFPVE